LSQTTDRRTAEQAREDSCSYLFQHWESHWGGTIPEFDLTLNPPFHTMT
jgi:Rps23 Pro-64 3,4-dihydroxylase Tpa1-like proline 4-hydroxylase